MTPKQPAINAPRIILILSIIMIGMHVLRTVSSEELARDILIYLALIPAQLTQQDILPGSGLSAYTSFITYSFLHADLTHITINVLSMLAFGSIAAWRLGAVKFLVLSSLCSIGGGLVHLFSHWGDIVPVIGASAIVSGHMAVACRFLDRANSFFLARGASVASLRPLSTLEVFKSRTALTFLSVWFGINLLIGLGGNSLGDQVGNIAWQAHLGGFLVGFLLFPFFDHSADINPDE